MINIIGTLTLIWDRRKTTVGQPLISEIKFGAGCTFSSVEPLLSQKTPGPNKLNKGIYVLQSTSQAKA